MSYHIGLFSLGAGPQQMFFHGSWKAACKTTHSLKHTLSRNSFYKHMSETNTNKYFYKFDPPQRESQSRISKTTISKNMFIIRLFLTSLISRCCPKLTGSVVTGGCSAACMDFLTKYTKFIFSFVIIQLACIYHVYYQVNDRHILTSDICLPDQ